MEQRSNPTPPLLQVLKAQLELLIEKPRKAICILYGLVLLQGVLSASEGLLLGIAIRLDESEPTSYEVTRVTDLGLEPGPAAITLTYFLMIIWAGFWPKRIWRGGKRASQGYFLTLPVSRATHQLARLIAGGLGLLALTAMLLLVVLLTATAFGNLAPLGEYPAAAWLCYFTGPLLAFLLMAVFPIRDLKTWTYIGKGTGLLALFWLGVGYLGIDGPAIRLARHFFLGDFGLLTALANPLLQIYGPHPWLDRPWLPALALWFAIALALIAWAASKWRSSA